MEYQEALVKLHQLTRMGISPGLERIEELTRRLGFPQSQLPCCIHISGTNGKGSVAAMLDAILRQEGRKTALFTSPHLQCHTERYRIDGRPITEERFAMLFGRVYQQIEDMVAEGLASPTEFEAVTALALLWFAEENVDCAVIEVGLGGLTDSTNVVEADLAIITNVGMDHMDFLGDTIAEIASYKAGIIKEKSLVVTAASGEALPVIEAKATSLKRPLYRQGQEFSFFDTKLSQQGTTLSVRTGKDYYRHLQLPLLGRHQLSNAAVAVQAAELLGVSESSIRAGLATVRWPARLEFLAERTPQILLDGAHNCQGMEALSTALTDLWPERRIVCLLGMLSDKERQKSLQLLLPHLSRVVVTRPPYLSRSEDWYLLADMCRAAGKEAVAIEDNRAALDCALQIAQDDDLLLVCGSLYMVAEIRKYLEEEKNDVC